MRGLTPGSVLDRKEKIGFSVPNRAWLALLPGMAGLLADALKIPAVEPVFMEPALRALRSGRPLAQAPAMAAWRLIGLALWARRFRIDFP